MSVPPNKPRWADQAAASPGPSGTSPSVASVCINDQLPPEVLALIFSYLHGASNRSSGARVCRLWRELNALPELWRESSPFLRYDQAVTAMQCLPHLQPRVFVRCYGTRSSYSPLLIKHGMRDPTWGNPHRAPLRAVARELAFEGYDADEEDTHGRLPEHERYYTRDFQCVTVQQLAGPNLTRLTAPMDMINYGLQHLATLPNLSSVTIGPGPSCVDVPIEFLHTLCVVLTRLRVLEVRDVALDARAQAGRKLYARSTPDSIGVIRGDMPAFVREKDPTITFGLTDLYIERLAGNVRSQVWARSSYRRVLVSIDPAETAASALVVEPYGASRVEAHNFARLAGFLARCPLLEHLRTAAVELTWTENDLWPAEMTTDMFPSPHLKTLHVRERLETPVLSRVHAAAYAGLTTLHLDDVTAQGLRHVLPLCPALRRLHLAPRAFHFVETLPLDWAALAGDLRPTGVVELFLHMRARVSVQGRFVGDYKAAVQRLVDALPSSLDAEPAYNIGQLNWREEPNRAFLGIYDERIEQPRYHHSSYKPYQPSYAFAEAWRGWSQDEEYNSTTDGRTNADAGKSAWKWWGRVTVLHLPNQPVELTFALTRQV